MGVICTRFANIQWNIFLRSSFGPALQVQDEVADLRAVRLDPCHAEHAQTHAVHPRAVETTFGPRWRYLCPFYTPCVALEALADLVRRLQRPTPPRAVLELAHATYGDLVVCRGFTFSR